MKYFSGKVSPDVAILHCADLIRDKSDEEQREIREEFEGIIPILREIEDRKYDGWMTQ